MEAAWNVNSNGKFGMSSPSVWNALPDDCVGIFPVFLKHISLKLRENGGFL